MRSGRRSWRRSVVTGNGNVGARCGCRRISYVVARLIRHLPFTCVWCNIMPCVWVSRELLVLWLLACSRPSQGVDAWSEVSVDHKTWWVISGCGMVGSSHGACAHRLGYTSLHVPSCTILLLYTPKKNGKKKCHSPQLANATWVYPHTMEVSLSKKNVELRRAACCTGVETGKHKRS